MLQNRKRYLVYGGLFVMMLISYIDRQNLSVAVGSIGKAYHLSPVAIGYLLSANLWSYLIVLVPLGAATDRWGVRWVTAGSLLVWSLGGIGTGLAAGFGALIGSRLVLGAGEAASYPVGGSAIRQWAPRSERGMAAAWLNSGAYAGPAIGAVAVGWIVTAFGWRASFVITGALGVVAAFLWFWWYRTPENTGGLSGAERELILRERDADQDTQAKEPFRAVMGVLLRSRSMWGLALAQGCAGYTLYLFLTWLPTYLATARGLSVLKSGMFTAVPYAAAVVLGLLLGRVSDAVLRRGDLAGGGRRRLIAACQLCSAVILVTPFVSRTWILLVLFSISLTCVSTAMGMNIALTNDLLATASRAGVAVSVLIFGGNLFGLLAPIVTGYAVSATGSFSAAFAIAGILLLVGTTVTLTLTRRPIDAPVGPASFPLRAGTGTGR